MRQFNIKNSQEGGKERAANKGNLLMLLPILPGLGLIFPVNIALGVRCKGIAGFGVERGVAAV